MRTASNRIVESRTARAKLDRRSEPYWTDLGAFRRVGYRASSGTWIAKIYDPVTGKRHYTSLGAADDLLDADGVTALSFRQAQKAAADWFTSKAHELAGYKPSTVAAVVESYLAWYKAHRKKSGYDDARARAARHIIPALGAVSTDRLTSRQIRAWHEALSTSPALLRGGQRRGPVPDEQRRRRASANRVLTILKSALNHAFVEGAIGSDHAWRRVRPFRGVESSRTRYLADDEIRRLVVASDPAFRSLVLAAVYTGCRYGELTALRVSDFCVDSGTLLIAQSKTNQCRHVVLAGESVAFFAGLVAGRSGDALLLTGASGAPWGKSHQTRPLAEACSRAGIDPAINFHALRHTHASRLAQSGTPMLVIATQLGHADTRMVEKHYAHLAPAYVAEAIRAGFSDLNLS